MNKFFSFIISFLFFSNLSFSQTKIAEINIPNGDITDMPVFIKDTINSGVVYMFYRSENRMVMAKGDSLFRFQSQVVSMYPTDEKENLLTELKDIAPDFANEKITALVSNSQNNAFAQITFDFKKRASSFNAHGYNAKGLVYIGSSIRKGKIVVVYLSKNDDNFTVLESTDEGFSNKEYVCSSNVFAAKIINRPLLGKANADNYEAINFIDPVDRDLAASVKVYFRDNFLLLTKESGTAETYLMKMNLDNGQQEYMKFYNKTFFCYDDLNNNTASWLTGDKLFQLVACSDKLGINVYSLSNITLSGHLHTYSSDSVVSFMNTPAQQHKNGAMGASVTTPVGGGSGLLLTGLLQIIPVTARRDIEKPSKVIRKLSQGKPFIYAEKNPDGTYVTTSGSLSIVHSPGGFTPGGMMMGGTTTEKLVSFNSWINETGTTSIEGEMPANNLRIGDAQINVDDKHKAVSVFKDGDAIYFAYYLKRNKEKLIIIKY